MNEIKEDRKDRIKLLIKLKPFSWGLGTEKTGKEIDEILYGLKK